MRWQDRDAKTDLKGTQIVESGPLASTRIWIIICVCFRDLLLTPLYFLMSGGHPRAWHGGR